jgi:hypothetical protein
MKNKILKTLLVFGLWSIPYALIERSEQISRKYLALGQMENSEVNYRMFQIADAISYFNVIVAALAIACLIAIWKQKLVEQK